MPGSTPCISFPGKARDAFEYYREVFGGTLDLMTYDGMATEAMPFEQAPWGDRYGQVKDRFGVLWQGDAGPA